MKSCPPPVQWLEEVVERGLKGNRNEGSAANLGYDFRNPGLALALVS